MSAIEQRWDVKRDAKMSCNLSFGAIKKMILKGAIKDGDLIRHTGMSVFRKVGEQEALKSFLNSRSQ